MSAARSSGRGPQIGLSFVRNDAVHLRLSTAARRHGMKPSRVVRELIRDYLPMWEADQRAHAKGLKRRLTRGQR